MMDAPRIGILKSHADAAEAFLTSHPQGHERAAIILFRRLHVADLSGVSDSDRYIGIEYIPFSDAWLMGSSDVHVAFRLECLREIFRRCKDEALVFGFVHNHPTGFEGFSQTDEENEKTLLKALSNRNGEHIHFIAMLFSNGKWQARVRSGGSPEVVTSARNLTITGNRMYVHEHLRSGDMELYARQAAAFGKPFVDMLASMRVGIVGCGGTGSATATLLARVGVGELVLIDHDKLEKSNLNRVRGARVSDVGKDKVTVLADFLKYLELPVRVTTIAARVDESHQAIDALASCDVIFGCTDDQVGRELMNTMVYAYIQPYLDMGLGGVISTGKTGAPSLSSHVGRLSVLLPEAGECLMCQSVISPEQVKREYELRKNPQLSETEAKDRYLTGTGGEQAPGVAPFTGAIADFAAAAFFNLLNPFWKLPEQLRSDHITLDFVKLRIASKERATQKDCPYCENKVFLLQRSDCRLGRPALGRQEYFV